MKNVENYKKKKKSQFSINEEKKNKREKPLK